MSGNRYIDLLLLFSAAIALKLFIFFTVSDPVVFFKYPFFADQLNKGMDIGERLLDLSPLYLYGMVFLQKIYGSNWEAMTVFQLLAGSFNGILIFLIGEKIFNRAVGLTAAVILMLYGNLTLFELTLEPDSFVLLLNSLFLLTVLWTGERSLNTHSALIWLWPGLILGLSVITKANALLIWPGVIFWIFWTSPGGKKIRYALLFTLGVSLLILPVTLRNYIQFHDPVLVTADMGKVFFHGNGPGATGMERADLPDQGFIEETGGEPDFAHTLFRSTARGLTHRNLSPSESSRFWVFRTLDHIRSHPYSAFKLLAKKFVLFWLNYEVHDLDTNYAYYQTIRAWPLVPFGLIAALGVVGMFLSRKNLKQTYLPFLMIAVYLLTVVIFFNASRYRLPAVPFLCLFAAYTILSLYDRLKRKQGKPFFLIAVPTVLLFILSVFSLRDEVAALDRWQQATRFHYNLGGNVFFKKGEYQKAIEEYKRAVALAPNFAPAYNQMGKAYAMLNDLSSSKKSFLKVIQLSPAVDQGYMNLGLIHALKGEKEKAAFYLEKAVVLNPKNFKAKEHLEKLMSR
ncbi:MAG: tetratricopeptide repeat protein [Deltaproteobacteria bacterium]|nr:tetratricopeptide repeat protein [Deltaproteobacteria bacterium]